MTKLEALRAEVNEWVEGLFGGFQYAGGHEQKIVRDAVHGYLVLEPYEVAILDSPVVQRLRYVHQTALAYLVYPSARHTRFEHSLGLIKTIDGMVMALRRGKKRDLVNDDVVRELRLSGLLHDTGHVLYSHLGESLMEDRFGADFEEAMTEGGDKFENANTGEFLAYLIITSEPFTRFLAQVAADYHVGIDAERIAGYIMGHAADAEKYRADIINGPFDADKLDYLLRDCHFCGIKADVDVERLYNTIDIWDAVGKPRYLVMRQTGIPILEQILFNKMLLYTAIYHHQKIRTLECMLRGIFEAIWEHPNTIREKSLRFERLSDFLNVTEFEFLALSFREEALRPMVQRILNRQLLKRCLMISMSSVSGETQKKMFHVDKLKTRSLADIKVLRKRVFEEIPADRRTSLYDLWIDLPTGPAINEDAVQCLIDVGEASPIEMSDKRLFPLDDWLSSYEMNKWKGHVFYVDPADKRRAAADAAASVLRSEFGIEFEALARRECKL